MKKEFYEKDRSYQLAKAQEEFNRYIRVRDKDQPCISCGQTHNKMTAGHYKSVGAYPELRFCEDNCHGQCWYNCNSNRSGNIIEYRKRLEEKLGPERLAWIEGPHETQNLTLEDIREIRQWFKNKTKRLLTDQ